MYLPTEKGLCVCKVAEKLQKRAKLVKENCTVGITWQLESLVLVCRLQQALGGNVLLLRMIKTTAAYSKQQKQ
jgi:hypothetical protein